MYEVLIKACNEHSFLVNIARDNDLSYKVLQFMPTYDTTAGGSMLLEFNNDECKMKQVMSYLKKCDRENMCIIDEVDMEKRSEEDYFLMIKLNYYLGSEVFLKSGCLFNGCFCDGKCVLVDILTCGNGSLYDFITILKDYDYNVEIIKKRGYDLDGNLTHRQKGVMHKAYDLGYFDIPKRISLKELSSEIGISPSSTDEIIKRAQKKIVSSYLLR